MDPRPGDTGTAACFYRKYGKRLLDLVLALGALLLLLPVLGLVAIAVRLGLGSPVIFRQRRLGREEQEFVLFKFRTMTDARDATGADLPDKERLTEIGRLLRRWSLDELPELWNVLRGEMSLVGPRPLLLRYLPFFTDEERARFAVRPGITGWAQVNGRNYSPWDERLRNDVWYVLNQSFLLDLRILLKTIAVTLGRCDVAVDANSILPNLDDERSSTGASRTQCD